MTRRQVCWIELGQISQITQLYSRGMHVLDLQNVSGLPIGLNDQGLLVFGQGVVVDERGVRLMEELTSVALEPAVCRGNSDIVYYMENGVYQQQDAGRLANVPMRYELTLIPARRIGREFVKTHGHLHHPEPQSGIDYAEVCEVLAGKAHFLFQTLNVTGPRASMAFYVEATAGQKVLMPPGFDHCTINPGPDALLFSDVIALGVSGIYDRFKTAGGAAYLEVSEDGQPLFIPNPTYQDVPPLLQIEPRDYPELELTSDVPLYTAFVRSRGGKWDFLLDPRRFWPTFRDLAAELDQRRRMSAQKA
jgi:glucose-6-phosphate isomerase